DADNRLVRSVDRDGRSISYSYDAQGHETGEVWSTGTTLAYGFDGNGNMTSASSYDSGTSASYAYALSYDSLGRVTSVIEPFGVTLAMGYDGRGNRTSLIDSLGGSEASTYDTANELVGRTLTAGGQTMGVSFVYDWAGRAIEEDDG